VARNKSSRNGSPTMKPEAEKLNSTVREGGDEADRKTPLTLTPVTSMESNSNWTRTLSYTNWIITSLFISLQLPYPFLVTFLLFVLIGVVTFLRGQPTGSKYNLPNISRKAIWMVRNIGSGQSGSSDPSSSNVSQIVSPRRGRIDFVKSGIPSPLSTTPLEDSPFTSTNCP